MQIGANRKAIRDAIWEAISAPSSTEARSRAIGGASTAINGHQRSSVLISTHLLSNRRRIRPLIKVDRAQLLRHPFLGRGREPLDLVTQLRGLELVGLLPHLMKEAIRRNQSQSDAIRRNQASSSWAFCPTCTRCGSSSEASRGEQRRSGAIRGKQER